MKDKSYRRSPARQHRPSYEKAFCQVRILERERAREELTDASSFAIEGMGVGSVEAG